VTDVVDDGVAEDADGRPSVPSFSMPRNAVKRSSALVLSRRSVAMAAVSGRATGIQSRAVKMRRLKSMSIRTNGLTLERS
jgi:hypothetical protein